MNDRSSNWIEFMNGGIHFGIFGGSKIKSLIQNSKYDPKIFQIRGVSTEVRHHLKNFTSSEKFIPNNLPNHFINPNKKSSQIQSSALPIGPFIHLDYIVKQFHSCCTYLSKHSVKSIVI